jgi:hypothetical protein
MHVFTLDPSLSRYYEIPLVQVMQAHCLEIRFQMATRGLKIGISSFLRETCRNYKVSPFMLDIYRFINASGLQLLVLVVFRLSFVMFITADAGVG